MATQVAQEVATEARGKARRALLMEVSSFPSNRAKSQNLHASGR